MSDPTAPTAPTPTARTAGRWMLTFAGFPLGGLLTDLVAGPIGSPGRAVAGGLLTGAVLGAVQVWGLGRARPAPLRWTLATALGLAAGLLAGTAVVGYGTQLTDLLVVGACCGAAVGALQAVVLVPVLGRPALAWPLALAAIWALGWAVTSAAGVQVEQQFSVFGSSGAIVVTALTVALPVLIDRRTQPQAGQYAGATS